MKKNSIRFLALLLSLALCLAVASCDLLGAIEDEIQDGVQDAVDDIIGGVVDDVVGDITKPDDTPDGDVTLGDGEGETDGSAEKDGDTVYVRMYRGYPANLAELLELSNTEGLTWETRCPTVVSVDTLGVATSEKCGKTLVTLTCADGKKTEISILVEEPVTVNGFAISGGAVDETVHHVSSLPAAERLLDEAILAHKSRITIDFEAIGSDYDPSKPLGLEIGNHVKLQTSYYPDTPLVRTFIIEYKADTASAHTAETSANTYYNLTNGNAVARDYYERDAAQARADDFEGFAINTSNKGERAVYNSEELWYVIEHGYKPVFTARGTNAERIYELCKTILREIITDGMSDYEKVLAIYEYLVEAVAYDYDAFFGNAPANDRCYYMEGVFDAGRAVCDGKSKAFLVLCRMEGIECVKDRGEAYDGTMGHAWNYVKVLGRWYLVDSTHGDAAHSVSSGIGAYYGCNVEFVTYGAFLLPLNHHAAEYKYSGMWQEIFASGEDADGGDIYYTDKLGDENYDFTLDSSAEAYAIVQAIVLSDKDAAFVLTFVSAADSTAVYTYFDSAKQAFNLDFVIYTTGEGDELVYIALFKSKN